MATAAAAAAGSTAKAFPSTDLEFMVKGGQQAYKDANNALHGVGGGDRKRDSEEVADGDAAACYKAAQDALVAVTTAISNCETAQAAMTGKRKPQYALLDRLKEMTEVVDHVRTSDLPRLMSVRDQLVDYIRKHPLPEPIASPRAKPAPVLAAPGAKSAAPNSGYAFQFEATRQAYPAYKAVKDLVLPSFALGEQGGEGAPKTIDLLKGMHPTYKALEGRKAELEAAVSELTKTINEFAPAEEALSASRTAPLECVQKFHTIQLDIAKARADLRELVARRVFCQGFLDALSQYNAHCERAVTSQQNTSYAGLAKTLVDKTVALAGYNNWVPLFEQLFMAPAPVALAAPVAASPSAASAAKASGGPGPKSAAADSYDNKSPAPAAGGEGGALIAALGSPLGEEPGAPAGPSASPAPAQAAPAPAPEQVDLKAVFGRLNALNVTVQAKHNELTVAPLVAGKPLQLGTAELEELNNFIEMAFKELDGELVLKKGMDDGYTSLHRVTKDMVTAIQTVHRALTGATSAEGIPTK